MPADKPIDRLDAGLASLRAINDLLVQAADGGSGLHLVSPERLSFLLGLVADELEDARDRLETAIPA